jgi:hypothetical protein
MPLVHPGFGVVRLVSSVGHGRPSDVKRQGGVEIITDIELAERSRSSVIWEGCLGTVELVVGGITIISPGQVGPSPGGNRRKHRTGRKPSWNSACKRGAIVGGVLVGRRNTRRGSRASDCPLVLCPERDAREGELFGAVLQLVLDLGLVAGIGTQTTRSSSALKRLGVTKSKVTRFAVPWSM